MWISGKEYNFLKENAEKNIDTVSYERYGIFDVEDEDEE